MTPTGPGAHRGVRGAARPSARLAAPGASEAWGRRALWELLVWALPRLGLRPRGFRRVRGQVLKRLGRRLADLGIGPAAYRERLLDDAAERAALGALCRVTISRFYRDRQMWAALRHEILPAAARLALARGEPLRAWSCGCASGEEPYTLSIAFRLEVAGAFPGLGLDIVATDADGPVLARAARGRYAAATLRELPPGWAERAFEPCQGELRLRDAYRQGVAFRRQDVRRRLPAGPFHLVLCRNLAFTYFDETTQRRVLEGLRRRIAPGGFLVLGLRESLPAGTEGLEPASGRLPVFRRGAAAGTPAPPVTRRGPSTRLCG